MIGGQIPTGIATGVAGSLFSAQVVNSIAAAGTFVPAAGQYYAYAMGADVRFQIQDLTGWVNVLAAGISPGEFETDGTNIRFINNGVSAETVTTVKIG